MVLWFRGYYFLYFYSCLKFSIIKKLKEKKVCSCHFLAQKLPLISTVLSIMFKFFSMAHTVLCDLASTCLLLLHFCLDHQVSVMLMGFLVLEDRKLVPFLGLRFVFSNLLFLLLLPGSQQTGSFSFFRSQFKLISSSPSTVTLYILVSQRHSTYTVHLFYFFMCLLLFEIIFIHIHILFTPCRMLAL